MIHMRTCSLHLYSRVSIRIKFFSVLSHASTFTMHLAGARCCNYTYHSRLVAGCASFNRIDETEASFIAVVCEGALASYQCLRHLLQDSANLPSLALGDFLLRLVSSTSTAFGYNIVVNARRLAVLSCARWQFGDPCIFQTVYVLCRGVN